MAQTPSTTAAKTESDMTTRELQEQIATLKADIAELTTAVTRYGKAQGEALKAQARAGLRSVAENGAERIGQAERYASAKYAETEDYVRANPATSVGIAAGLGFLVGLMSSRR